MLGRRRVVVAAAGAALFLPAVGRAQAWPAKPVRIIVPYAPGGTTDIFARVVGDELSKRLGQQFIVESKAGAGATVGSEMVARAAPDGYTLVLTTISGNTISPWVYKKTVKYDGVADFAHIAVVAMNPSVLVVNPNFEARTYADYIAYAKRNPGKLAFATSGAGSSNHLLGVLTQIEAGVQMTHIPYRGAGPAMADVIAGQVPSMFDSLPSASAHIRGGKVRALAVSGDERNPAFPDVPTMKEAGYPKLISYSWFGVAGPAGMPKEIVDRLWTEIMAAMKEPHVIERWKQLGADTKTWTPAEVHAFVRAESERWKPIVESSGATAD